MSYPHIENQKKICREEWFKNHRAEITIGEPIVINWQNPESWNYGCRFIIHSRWLIVVGDIGEAVYEWSENLTLKFLAGLDFGYFKSKCQASETGRNFDEWDHDFARETLAKEIARIRKEREPGESRDAELDALQEITAFDKESFREAATEYYNATSDAEGAGSIADMGMIPSCRCVGHYVGLQMAIALLNK